MLVRWPRRDRGSAGTAAPFGVRFMAPRRRTARGRGSGAMLAGNWRRCRQIERARCLLSAFICEAPMGYQGCV